MKNLSTLLSAAILGCFSLNANAQYCTAGYTTGCGTYISQVSTANGIINFSNSSNCGTNGYTDFTGTGDFVKQDAGKTVNITINVPSDPTGYSGKVNIYIDWNQNEIFEPNAPVSELIAPATGHYLVHSSNSGQQSITIPVDVPLEAKDGLTRMRIRMGSNGSVFTSSLAPCGIQGPYGETEDYDFEVVNPCLPPDVISFTNLDYKSVTVSWSEKKNAEIYEYNLQQTPTPPGMGQVGFNFIEDETVDINNLNCGEKYYFLLRCICDSSGTAATWDISNWIIDSFIVPECCYSPNTTIDKIGYSSIQFSWAPVPTSYDYEYAVTTTATPPPKGTLTTKTTILQQGLQPRTNYYVHVRSLCSPTPLSGWQTNPAKTLKGVSVENISATDFSITAYPNPVGNALNVQLDDRLKGGQLQLTDVAGKVIYNTAVNNNEISINTTDLPKGIYLLNYTNSEYHQTLKVTK